MNIVKIEKEFRKHFQHLFEYSEPWGLEYNLQKIELIISQIEVVINAKIEEVKTDIELEKDEDVENSIKSQPINFFYLNDYHDTVRKSLFISLCSFFEIGLMQIIELLKEFQSVDDKMEKIDQKGKILNNAKLLNTSSSEWNIITDLFKIRNCIIHNDSFVQKKHHDLIQKLNNQNFPGIFFNGYIRINEISFINYSNFIFRSIYNEIDKQSFFYTPPV